MKLVLQEPFKVGENGDLITELVFREKICAGDLRGMKISSFAEGLGNLDNDEALKIAGRLTGRTDLEMSKLGLFDLFKVLEIVGGFFMTGLGIGKTP